MDGDEMVKIMKDITLEKEVNTDILNSDDKEVVSNLKKDISKAKKEGLIIEWPDDVP